MVSPETIENCKKTIEPIKESYFSAAYLKYLLDKPAKKKKQTRYDKANSLIANSDQSKQLDNNNEIIKGLLR